MQKVHITSQSVQGDRSQSSRGGRLVLLLFSAGLMTLCGCSQSSADTQESPVYGTIEAHNFVVRGPEGERRAEFGMTAQGRFELVIYDEQQKRRATLSEQGLMLFNSEERVQARLDLMGDKPRLNFLDSDGDLRYKAP